MGEIIERGNNFTSKVCPICGKSFIPTYSWAYKKDYKFYCRYNCYKLAGGDDKKYRTNIKRG
jgi:hypothetical protein